MSSYNNIILENFSESSRLLLLFGLKQVESIGQIAEAIVRIYQHGGKVIFCGNGGSAAEAEHLCAEMIGRFKMQRNPLPAIALTGNSSTTTAISNDLGYSELFARQIQGLAQPGDLLIAMSTSGHSPNILNAIETAKNKKVFTVGWTGLGGTELEQKVDLALVVPSHDTPRIQEAHLVAGHIICSLVELTLYGESNV